MISARQPAIEPLSFVAPKRLTVNFPRVREALRVEIMAPRPFAETFLGFADRLEMVYATTDWGDNDEDANRIVPTLDTRKAAMDLVLRLGRTAVDTFGQVIPIPDLSSRDDGGVDIHWGHGAARELLLGIREHNDGIVSFYGDSTNGSRIKGATLARADNVFLAAWLLAK